MSDCSSIERLFSPYVDGELDPAGREQIEQHTGTCARCCYLLAAERTAHEVLLGRRSALLAERAPSALQARCARLGASTSELLGPALREVAPAVAGPAAGRFRTSTLRARLVPLAAAAVLVLIVGGAFLVQATRSSVQVMAAELAADHVKCFALNAMLGTEQSAQMVETAMTTGFGWPLHLPDNIDRQGLELVGSRPCLYGEGKIAHVMYRHNGEPVSLFMLPHTERVPQSLRVLGHECAIWSGGDRTFVLVARESRAQVEQLAAFVRQSVH